MKGKRFLTGLLTAAMVLSSLPMTAFAEDGGSAELQENSPSIVSDDVQETTSADEFEIVLNGTGYESLQAAIDEASEGDTILVTAEEIELPKITKTGLIFKTTDNTKIINEINCHPDLGWGDKYTFDGFEFTQNAKLVGADMSLLNCNFTGVAGTRFSYPTGTWTIDNCTFNQTGAYGVHADGGTGTINITNSVITGWNSFGNDVIVNFDNCTFKKGNSNYSVLRTYANLTVSNSTFEADWATAGSCYFDAVDSETAMIEIINTEFKPGNIFQYLSGSHIGTFMVDASMNGDGLYTGGTFDKISEGTVADGYNVVVNEDGTYTVKEAYSVDDGKVVVSIGEEVDGNGKVTVDADDIKAALAAVTPADTAYDVLVLDTTDENRDKTEITLTSDLIAALSGAANNELVLCIANANDGDVTVDKAFITALKAAADNNDITMTLADTTNVCAVSNAISVVFAVEGEAVPFPDAGKISLYTGYWLNDYEMDDLMVGTPKGKVSVGQQGNDWDYEADSDNQLVWVSMDVTAWGDYYLTSDEVRVYTEAKDTDAAGTVTVGADDIAEALAAVTPADAEYDMLVLVGTEKNQDTTKITLKSDLITALSEAENENLILCLATYRYDGNVLVDKEFITALKAAAGNNDITMTLADVVNSNAIPSQYGFNAYNVVFEVNGTAITFPTTGWIGLDAAYVLNGYDMKDLMIGTPKGNVAVGDYEVAYYNPEEPEETVVKVSVDMTAWGDYYLTVTYSGGNSGGGGGGSSKPSTSTTTNKNEDGSTTTTTTNTTTGTVTEKTENTDGSTVTVETKKDGTVTETKENADGSKETLETKADGTVTATVENTDGSKATMETKTDGTITTTAERADGVTTQTVETSGGNVTAEVSVPAGVAQAVVTIPVAAEVTPGLVAMDATTGEIIKLSVPAEGGVNVALTESANIVLVDNSKDFADTTGHWGSDAVDFVSSRNIMNGVDSQSFDPDSDLTRGQIATILRNIETNPAAATEAPSFDDIAEDHWAAESVAWAAENGFVSGYNDGTYGVNDSITREQLASILYRYAGSPAVSGSLAGFAEDGSVSGYAQNAMIWATQQGLISGVGENTLDPQGTATRAQVASIIMRYISSLAK